MNKVYKIDFYFNCPKLSKHYKPPIKEVYHGDSTKISQSWKMFYICISINKLITMGKLQAKCLERRRFSTSAAQKTGGKS